MPARELPGRAQIEQYIGRPGSVASKRLTEG